MFTKLLVTLFVFFALSRVWLRHRDRSVGLWALLLWSLLWVGVEVFVWMPKASDVLAGKIGIGRGADALVYFSIVILFYGAFRLYIKLEALEHELTTLVRTLTLREQAEKEAEHDASMTS